jgi:hypothetical protein
MAPLAGLVVAVLAIGYAEGTGHPYSQVLFSGQAALPPLVQHAASYTAGALLLLVAMSAVMLSLPLTSVLLATILIGSDGLAVTPLVVVAVVVAHVAAARMAPDDSTTPAGPARPAATAGTAAAPSANGPGP